MLVMFPLTAKQAKSMMAMQRAQPEIKKLQAKYKNDRAKLNEEMMKFYQENKINPLGGLSAAPGPDADLPRALPRDARARTSTSRSRRPLRRVLHRTRRRAAHVSECNVPKLGLPNPQYFLGMDLSQNATAVTGGFLDALPYFILVGLVIVTGFLQARQSRATPPNMNSQMAIITQILPDRLRPLLAAVPRRPRPLLPGEQPLATRPAGDHHAQDHPTRAGGVGGVRAEDAIDVEGADDRDVGRPTARSPGALRKLFQLPAAAERRQGAPKANGAKRPAPNGRPSKPASKPARGKPRRRPRRQERLAGSAEVRASGERRASGASQEQQEAQATLTAARVEQPDRGGEQVQRRSERAITMEWVETTGRTIAEALDAALDELGVDEDDVEYEVLEEPKSGFLGRFGSSEAASGRG